MTPLFRKFLGLNWVLVILMYLLLIFGVVCIYYAGMMKEVAAVQNAYNKQILLIVIGSIVFFGTSLIDYRWVFWGGVPLYFVGLGLSILTLFAGKESEIHGHKIQFTIAGLSFQPSQIAVAGGIVMTALILGHLHKVHPIFRNPFFCL